MTGPGTTDNIWASLTNTVSKPRGIHVQENVPAEQPQAQEGAWVPRADEHRKGAPGAETPARQGPEEINGFDELTQGERLTRDDRLHSRGEFDAVYSRGVRIPGRCFILFILPNARGRSRLGVTLSRKVGDAVVRNRARRRIREIFRRRRSLMGSSIDIVVHGRQEIAGQPQSVLERQLVEGIARFEARHGGGR